jgi:hypothetical protein
VTDDGAPQMSATNSFKVVVYRANTAPVLSAISDQTVYANTLLSFTASATDTDQPPQSLTFTLGAGAPSGASITTNGVFSWTPTWDKTPSTNTIFVIVTDDGVPPMSATNSFNVTVYSPNTAPVLVSISNQVAHPNSLLTFTAIATDTDLPPQALTFRLEPGAPAGAAITTNGLFSWNPTTAQSPSTNLITVTVMDSGVPVLSDSQTFEVVVSETNTVPDLVLQSATSLTGQFSDELEASIDTGQKAITVAKKSSSAFYRLRASTPTRILQIQIEGTQVLLKYE